uniref:Uncharacterized protein n=2 Tax=Triticum TaxID=4564 RepID=A0A8R7VG94_TRIUA
GERIKDQIVQTLTEAGGQVDYVEAHRGVRAACH